MSLTIRCVEKVRSLLLTRILSEIIEKLAEAMKSRVERLMNSVGRLLAERLSQIAQRWGNPDAHRWATNQAFIRFLTIVHMNTPPMFRAPIPT